MAILDSGEILVLHMIIGDKIIPKPLLDVNVVTTSESGMLGIVVAEHYQGSNKSYVFLYFTEAQDKDGGKSIGHRVYRYELTGGGYRERLLILITLIYMIY
jgi:hypothetical protein